MIQILVLMTICVLLGMFIEKGIFTRKLYQFLKNEEKCLNSYSEDFKTGMLYVIAYIRKII